MLGSGGEAQQSFERTKHKVAISGAGRELNSVVGTYLNPEGEMFKTTPVSGENTSSLARVEFFKMKNFRPPMDIVKVTSKESFYLLIRCPGQRAAGYSRDGGHHGAGGEHSEATLC